MKAKKIQNSDIDSILISSLPPRPTAPKHLGGRGYTSSEMKEAFDKLPLFIIERYNTLIADISSVGENSLAAAIPTDIKDSHTLCDLFDDLRTGELATYFCFLGKSLLSHIITLYGEIDDIKSKLTCQSTEKKEDAECE